MTGKLHPIKYAVSDSYPHNLTIENEATAFPAGLRQQSYIPQSLSKTRYIRPDAMNRVTTDH